MNMIDSMILKYFKVSMNFNSIYIIKSIINNCLIQLKNLMFSDNTLSSFV